ncbi:MAG: FtsB family cell division protein [Bacteroidia bacterium]
MERFSHFTDNKVVRLFKNKYLAVLAIAAIWMLFFDRYNLLSQFKMRDQLQKLKADKELYKEGVESLDYEIDKLFTDPRELEKFAREQYWLKRSNEEVFIIEEEE